MNNHLNQLELFNLGQTHEAAGCFAAAETCYRKAGAPRSRARVARRRTEDAFLADLSQSIVAAETAEKETP